MSEEWKLARRGRLTASSRARSIAGPRAKQNWPKLKDKLLWEMSDGWEWQEASLAALDWGNEHERRALSMIEFQIDGDLEEPGFLLHPNRPYAGGTPDGLIRGLAGTTAVQVKCPHDPDIHLKTLLAKKLANKQYWFQLQWEGWITDADALLFASFDPRQRRTERQLALVPIPVDWDVRHTFEQRCDEFHAFMDGHLPKATPVGIDSLATML